MAYFCTLSGEDLSLSLPTRGGERARALAGHMASALAPEEGAGAKNVDEGLGSAVGRPSRHRVLRSDAAEVLQEGGCDRRTKTKKRAARAAKGEGRARYGCAFEEEEEGIAAPNRLVWSKVKGYPWWPAQVLDPADASALALAERRKDGAVLVANFWQKTFAWVSGAAALCPFRDGFRRFAAVDRAHVQLWGARATMSPFASALDTALGEVARRVEAGLSCGCAIGYRVSKKQVIDNPGVREGAQGAVVDAAFTRDAFRGEAFVEYVSALAVAPLAGADRLELTVAMAQLTAFTRWRGTRGLPVYTACHGIDGIADGVREGTPARRVTKRGRPKGDNAAEHKRKMSRYCTCDGSASESAEDPLEMEEKYEPRPQPASHQTTTKMGRLMSQAAHRMSLSPVSHKADLQANAAAGVTMAKCTGAAAAPSVKPQNGGLNKDEPLLTGLSLNFTGPDTVPPASDLVKIFSKFGPVVEARPEGLTVSMVIFKRKLDAEAAFSSTPKIRALDPNLVSYRLAYALPAPTPVDSPQSPMNTDEMDHLFVDDDEALQ
ncbi:hypothetical protein CFC21_000667 [Triticum aestivum]|uniref:PWWP domain-containing protein n=2 Tax=Triticum TaxID=4564 RepID=A0A9R0PVB9_TRITD|nr:uncharacterized protein LOC123086277 [Triticum aestivum]KAF6982247.1 hypothetical protein CFC21_000667 [Triticum aestivum]VAH01430.1 unnamed protein product [Triticum turgidum subsp. durum]